MSHLTNDNETGRKFSTSEFFNTGSEMCSADEQAKRRQSEREKEQTRRTTECRNSHSEYGRVMRRDVYNGSDNNIYSSMQ